MFLQKFSLFSILTKDASGYPMVFCWPANLAHFSSKLITWHAILVHFSKFWSTRWPKTCGTCIRNLDIISLVLRGKNELESDFKRFWEEFRSSSSEKVPWHLLLLFFSPQINSKILWAGSCLDILFYFSLCRRKKRP